MLSIWNILKREYCPLRNEQESLTTKQGTPSVRTKDLWAPPPYVAELLLPTWLRGWDGFQMLFSIIQRPTNSSFLPCVEFGLTENRTALYTMLLAFLKRSYRAIFIPNKIWTVKKIQKTPKMAAKKFSEALKAKSSSFTLSSSTFGSLSN